MTLRRVQQINRENLPALPLIECWRRLEEQWHCHVALQIILIFNRFSGMCDFFPYASRLFIRFSGSLFKFKLSCYDYQLLNTIKYILNTLSKREHDLKRRYKTCGWTISDICLASPTQVYAFAL